MTVRNLEYLVRPSCVALIGASEKTSTVGEVIARNLLCGGFGGEIYLVNPNYDSLAGLKCYPDVKSLPKVPDLAVIATPRETVPGIVEEIGWKGTKAAVVITAGFGEGGDEQGKRLSSKMLDAARPHLLRIAGPNCLGIMVPASGLNASMAHITRPIPGHIAFVAQSGAVQTAVLDWSMSRGIGFSCFISLGDMADVDFGDMLDFLSSDFRTRAILLYMETVTHARKFMSAARAAARIKPVIVFKAGRSPAGAAAAARHTGSKAGKDAVCEAAFRRAGMLRVHEMQSLFDAVETIAMMPHAISGDRLAIITNGGGVGVIATDALVKRKGRLARLSPETIQKLDSVLPPAWSGSNPVDIMSHASAADYGEAMEAVLADPGVDAALVLNCPIAVTSGRDAAEAVISKYKERLQKPHPPILLTSWLGDQAAQEARKLFSMHRIPSYKTPTDAVRAFMHMVRYQKNQDMLMETPPSIPESFSPDVAQALGVIEDVLTANRQWLSENETRALLAAYGIPMVPSLTAKTPEEAAEHAATLGGIVTLEILSPDIPPKDSFRGMAFHLETPESVKKAAEAMRDYLGKTAPDVRLEGFTIQPVLRRPHAQELTIGMIEDSQFGPVIAFGHGGEAAEEIQDIAVALPPLNMHLAREVMSRTRIYRLLRGKRGMPPADLDAVALTLVKVSQLICDIAEIAEMEINPLLADTRGVLALNARIRVLKSNIPASERLAIRPYPKELEDTITLSDGQVMQIRPIRPEDEPGFYKIFESLSPEDRRMRFLHPVQELSHKEAARLTQIDYDREMALVLASKGSSSSDSQELYGSVRIIADPDNERAEYAILVRRDMAGRGMGKMLMQRVIDYARSRGIKEIFGQVLSENIPMLKVCNTLGFTQKRDPDDPGVIIVSLKL